MGYCGIFYGTTLKSAGTPYGATEWARAEGTVVFTRKIVGEAAFDWANANTGVDKLLLMDGGLKYMNVWGRSAYANAYDWGAFGLGWDLGPSNVGEPSLVLNGSGGSSVYGCRMTDRHIARFHSIVEAAMLSTALPCLGVFPDDHFPGRQHWSGADRARAWGAMNGRAGYESDAYNWNLVRMNLLNARLSALLGQLSQHGITRQVLCNSGHSTNYTGLTRYANLPWMWEGYQRWYSRAYLRGLMNNGTIQAGDVLVLQGRHLAAGPTETWAADLAADSIEVVNGGRAEHDSYGDIWDEARVDAAEFGLDIALGWHPETSGHAGLGLDSSYSCLTDPATLE